MQNRGAVILPDEIKVALIGERKNAADRAEFFGLIQVFLGLGDVAELALAAGELEEEQGFVGKSHEIKALE